MRKIEHEFSLLDPEKINYYSDIHHIAYKVWKEYRESIEFVWENLNPIDDTEDIKAYRAVTSWDYNPKNYTTFYYINNDTPEQAIESHFYELIRERITAKFL